MLVYPHSADGETEAETGEVIPVLSLYDQGGLGLKLRSLSSWFWDPSPPMMGVWAE